MICEHRVVRARDWRGFALHSVEVWCIVGVCCDLIYMVGKASSFSLVVMPGNVCDCDAGPGSGSGACDGCLSSFAVQCDTQPRMDLQIVLEGHWPRAHCCLGPIKTI